MKNILYRFIFRERPWMWKLTLIVILLAGFGLRLVDLTDLPLDFASTRQLYSALKARAMYYEFLPDAPAWQQEVAARGNFENIEPPVMEFLVSQTWRVTGEHLWVARLYSSSVLGFWRSGTLLPRPGACLDWCSPGFYFDLSLPAFWCHCQSGFSARSAHGGSDYLQPLGSPALAKFIEVEMGIAVWSIFRFGFVR